MEPVVPGTRRGHGAGVAQESWRRPLMANAVKKQSPALVVEPTTY